MIIKKPKIVEMYKGELYDFLVDLIAKEAKAKVNTEDHTRRRDLCRAFLAENPKVGVGDSLKADLERVLKDWQAKPEQINALEKLGFSCNKENRKEHYRIRWKNLKEYVATLPSSPSDRKEWQISLSNLKKKFF